MKQNVLFVCIHNSARSQMAEAFLNEICGNKFQAFSAGIEPGKLNPIVVETMREIGIDISRNKTKAVESFVNSGKIFNHVITVCDEVSAEKCPVVPGGGKKMHWGFADPSGFTGTKDEKLKKTREVRDAIKARVNAWCFEVCDLDRPTSRFNSALAPR